MALYSRHALELAAAAALVVAMTRDASALDPPLAPGVWKMRELTISQTGFTTTYSCTGLASKLKLLLRAAGAREDVRVVPIGCGDPGAPNAFARAHVVFHVLDPAPAGEKIGAWRSVALASRSPHELARGDCELVELFRAQVLPLLVTRNVVDRVRCVPHKASSSIDLRFQVFTRAAEKE